MYFELGLLHDRCWPLTIDLKDPQNFDRCFLEQRDCVVLALNYKICSVFICHVNQFLFFFKNYYNFLLGRIVAVQYYTKKVINESYLSGMKNSYKVN